MKKTKLCRNKQDQDNALMKSKIEFQAMLDKCALENPDLPIEFIRGLLVKKQDKSKAKPFYFIEEE